MQPSHNKYSHGFTLIELSIVIVIIGLLAGGVLIGKDLIQAAIIRQQITQYENFNTAVNTFKSKYNAYPGDMLPDDAAAFGFAPRSGSDGSGDNDGIVEGCVPYEAYQIGCESVLFWRDLSEAQLIPDSLHTATDSTPIIPAGTNDEFLYFPRAKLGYNKLILIGTNNQGQEWYVMLRGLYYEPPFGGFNWASSPAVAYTIDSKIDDGLPLSGIFIIATPGTPPDNFFGTVVQGPGYCVDNDVYNFAYTNEYCMLLAKMQTGL